MADTKLFTKNVETPAGTIQDTTMRFAYGKLGKNALNITIAGFLTWLNNQLPATFMKRANNLDDITSPDTCRANINAAGKYLSIINFTTAGGTPQAPTKININPDAYDIINLASATGGQFSLPFTDAYSIATGKVITIANTGLQDKQIMNAETNIVGLTIYIKYQGSITFYWYNSMWNVSKQFNSLISS
jgi:hypothetical protein